MEKYKLKQTLIKENKMEKYKLKQTLIKVTPLGYLDIPEIDNKKTLITKVATVLDFCVVEINNKPVKVETVEVKYIDLNKNCLVVQINDIDYYCYMVEDDYITLMGDMCK